MCGFSLEVQLFLFLLKFIWFLTAASTFLTKMKKNLILWCFKMQLLSVRVLLKCWASEQDKAFEESKPVLEALKSKGVSAVGAAGFCYGGEFIFRFCHLYFFIFWFISFVFSLTKCLIFLQLSFPFLDDFSFLIH